jgi:hypothetical protein
MALSRKFYFGIFLSIIIVSIFAYLSFKNHLPQGKLGSAHEHVDFKVYLEGKAVDFSKPQYQLRSKYIHLENNDGDVIHVHATGITLGFFFKTLGIEFSNECFILDRKERYCNNEGKTLKLYVNGQENGEFERYLLKDKDKILVSYGDESYDEIEEQLKSITNKSEKAKKTNGGEDD